MANYNIPQKYDSQQRIVISLDEGYNLVLAPPGCGKTDILAERIARANSMGVGFNDMLCLTFTNRAARGMRTRIIKRLGTYCNFSNLFIGNFHRFCSKFLFDNNYVPMSTSILDETDTLYILQSLKNEEETLDIDYETKKSYERIANLQHLVFQMKSGHPRDILLHIEDCLRKDIRELCNFAGKLLPELYDSIEDISEDQYPLELLRLTELYDSIEDLSEDQYPQELKETYRLVYSSKLYENYKIQYGAIDFDDLLLITYNIINNPSEIFHKYTWIQVDEVQDLNSLEFAIIDRLTNKDNRFVVVYLGDEQQAIFSFIGAKLENLEFLKNRCGGKPIHLFKNYRSPKYLLDVYNHYANCELGINTDFLPDTDFCPKKQDDDLVIDNTSYDTFTQHDTATIIAKRYAERGERVAILVTTNADADAVSQILEDDDIRHFKISGTDAFLSPEMQMLIAHFSVINFEQNTIAWAKIFRQLKLFPKYALARDFSKALADNLFTPIDFIRYDNSSYVSELIKAFNSDLVIFDTETTGLDIFNDDIVQIAAIRVQKQEIIESFNVFLETEKEIPLFLDDTPNPLVEVYKTAKKVKRDEGLLNFLQFIGSTPILGHNVNYDYHILDYNLQRDCAIFNLNELCPVFFDSLKFARIVVPNLKVYKLKFLLEALNLEGKNSHMADDDILATYEVVKHCAQIAESRLSLQFAFRYRYSDTIRKFRSLYKDIYEHTQSILYNRLTEDEAPALVKELNAIYVGLLSKEIISDIEKFQHIMKFLEYDIIDKSKEASLFEQLNNHVMELNTFKEADLCDSSIITEKYFISTVHKAKGLEFENVIVLNVVEDVYPYYNSYSIDKIKEDARKLYVAISRAKKRLYLLTSYKRNVYSRKWQKWFEFDAEPSRFLNSISGFFRHISSPIRRIKRNGRFFRGGVVQE